MPQESRADQKVRADHVVAALRVLQLTNDKLDQAVRSKRKLTFEEEQHFLHEYGCLTERVRTLIATREPVTVAPTEFRLANYAHMNAMLKRNKPAFWQAWRRLRELSMQEVGYVAKGYVERGQWLRAQHTRVVVICNLIEIAAIGALSIFRLPNLDAVAAVRRIANEIAVVEFTPTMS